MSGDRRFLIWAGAAWLALLVVSLEFAPEYFRPSEMLRHPEEPVFLANRSVTMDRYGDLAFKNRLGAFIHRTRVTFTTDAWGLRNPTLDALPRIVVLGDSFTMGLGLDDSATISARLTARLGEPVYNYGCYGGASAARFLADERFVETPPEIVILMPASRQVEAHGVGPAPPQASPSADLGLRSWAANVSGRIVVLQHRIKRSNRLGRLCRSLLSTLRYALTGTVDQGEVISFGGEDKLVLELEHQKLTETPEQRGLDATVGRILEVRRRVEARGSRFVFSQCPEVGLVYEEQYPADRRPRIVRPRFYDLLFARLSDAGVTCVDVLPGLRANRSPYLFLPADTHWNARGMDLAASVIADRVRSLR